MKKLLLFVFAVSTICFMSCSSSKSLSSDINSSSSINLDGIHQDLEFSTNRDWSMDEMRQAINPGSFLVKKESKDSILFQHETDIDFLLVKISEPSTKEGKKMLKLDRDHIFFWKIEKIVPNKRPTPQITRYK